MASFEPDEPITAVRVRVHTADVAEGGTDDDIFIELFDPPEEMKALLPVLAVEIDTDDHDDFERGAKKTYHLPSWYFTGRIVNDIVRVRIHKSDDGLWGGWAFAGMTVWVNDKELSTSVDPTKPLGVVKWLEDDDRTFANPFKRIKFVAPTLVNLGLPDAGSDESYKVVLKARGGRKKLSWTLLSSEGAAFSSGPELVNPSSDGTKLTFTGHTVSTSTSVPWKGVIRITDAEGRKTDVALGMKAIHSLPPPDVKALDPEFGWPALSPAEPEAVRITLKGKNFDSRALDKTAVHFPTVAGSTATGNVLDATSSALLVEVPAGAAPGELRVVTEFGEGMSPLFTAHRDGYRHRSGMNFRNRVTDDDASDGFPDTFAWERFEQTFGVCEMFICIAGHGTVPNPIATSTFLVLHDAIDNGCCHGFGLTSLQMRRGIIGMLAYPKRGLGYPLDDGLFDLSQDGKPALGLSKTIQSRQLVMMSDEAMSYYLDKVDSVPNVSGQLCKMDGRPVLSDMEKAIQNGLTNPRLIAFAKNCALWEGHVVVPYDLEAPFSSAGIEMRRIRVYDPNRPAVTVFDADPEVAAKQKKNAELSVFTVRTGDGAWSYKWNNGDTWDGIYFFTIPLSEYGHQEDWTLPGLGTLAGTIGILLGYAGVTDEGELVQATAHDGRTLFDEHGDPHADRSLWPPGLRLVPGLAPRARRRRIVALTDSKRATFRVRPRGKATEPPLFSLLYGGVATTVEDFETTLDIDVDPEHNEVRIAPPDGTASAIVSFATRLPKTREALSYAIRVRGLAPHRPFSARSAFDGEGVEISPHDRDLELDVQITHISRLGEQRVFEHDSLVIPRGRSASLRVSDPRALENEGATPVSFTLTGPGTDQTVDLGARVTGPVVRVPLRLIVKVPRPKITIPGTKTKQSGGLLEAKGLKVAKVIAKLDGAATSKVKPPLFEVNVDISGSSSGDAPARVRALGRYGGAASSDDGRLRLHMPDGTRPIRLVAEDAEGHASFPRTVFVTVATPDERFHSPVILFGDDVVAGPGDTIEVPLAVYTTDVPVHGVAFELSARTRVSGLGRDRPSFGATAFVPHPDLPNPSVSQKLGRGGFSTAVKVGWHAAQARRGRVELGVLLVTLPTATTLGSTFLVESRGEVVGPRSHAIPVNGIPAAVRVWGGPEPAAMSIEGPPTVSEDADAVFHVNVKGLSGKVTNVGWWIDGVSGRARVVQDRAQRTKATVQGERAGFVKVMAVVGTSVAETLVHVIPPTEGHPLTSIALQNLTPSLTRHFIRHRLQRAVKLVPAPPQK